MFSDFSQAIINTLYGALGIIAGSQGTMNNHIYGNETYQNYETICGGSGAGSDFIGQQLIIVPLVTKKKIVPPLVRVFFMCERVVSM